MVPNFLGHPVRLGDNNADFNYTYSDGVIDNAVALNVLLS